MQVLQTLFNQAFKTLNLSLDQAQITLSNRPDLCDFQCNGALALAKQHKKPPRQLAEAILNNVRQSLEAQNQTSLFVFDIAGPGFINIILADQLLAKLVGEQAQDPRLGCAKTLTPETIVLDFGGPNVAKEMHVGHLRSAIIGESIQRIMQFVGHKTISDVHLGDWGLPYGKTILELKFQQPDLVYFDNNFQGEYPEKPPVNLQQLNTLYREGNVRCKQDEQALEDARLITAQMQKGAAGYQALWRHFVTVSVAAIRQNYQRLDVNFDYWYGESDAYEYIDKVTGILKSKNLLVESQGAQVIDVASPADGEKPLHPLIFFKNNGAVTYGSTDVATVYQRQQDFAANRIVYVVDQRQSLHFTQVFRAAAKAGFLDNTTIHHIGFGTINGKDGKPLKTRDGEQIFLNTMLDEVYQAAKSLLPSPESAECKADQVTAEDLEEMAEAVAMAAVKFNDMKNNPVSDYIFDLEQCTKFEGKTGPYLQYAVARINSILEKAPANWTTQAQITLENEFERKLAFTLLQFEPSVYKAFNRYEPSALCDHAYEVAQVFSRFYTECPILNQSPAVLGSRLALAKLTKQVLSQELELLGIQTPERIYTRRD